MISIIACIVLVHEYPVCELRIVVRSEQMWLPDLVLLFEINFEN